MFKKILMTLATTTLVASPIISSQAQAQAYGQPHRQEQTRTVVKQQPHGRTVVKQKTTVRKATPARHWAKGQRLTPTRPIASSIITVRMRKGVACSSGTAWLCSRTASAKSVGQSVAAKMVQKCVRLSRSASACVRWSLRASIFGIPRLPVRR